MALARGMTEEERDNLRGLGGQIAACFTRNPNVRFDGFAGLGRHGGALRMSEAASAKQRSRKFIIKYSYGGLTLDPEANADDDLRNEYRWLKMLRGAEHIVQLVDFADCSLNIAGVSNGEDTYEESVQKMKDEEAASGGDGDHLNIEDKVRRSPTFALEYIEYGTLFKLLTLLWRSGQKWVPSRLLWRIWLCMVRQCVAMAYPPDIPDDLYTGELRREVIQNEKPLSTLTQNSAHGHNFMFGEPQLPGSEHEPNLPIVKLIDFGRGRIDDRGHGLRLMPNNPQAYPSLKNLVAAARALTRVCCPDKPDTRDHAFQNPTVWYTYNNRDGSTTTIQTIAPVILIENKIIDPELRDLLVRIFAWPWEVKPNISTVLQETERGLLKDPDYPGLLTPEAAALGVQETDAAIRDFVQRFIYDAVDTEV
ncbi:hypothetical protein GGR51DRAFT_576348 [Nemania sp. FL0031]|nr:hypothetical protein GGR51DRAFT_576348 [Nemania sp. FL0031]